MKETAVLFIWDRMGDYHQARIKACRASSFGKVFSADLGSADSLYKWDNIKEKNHFELSNKPVHQKDFFYRFKSFKRIIHEKKITDVAMGYGRPEYLFFLLYAKIKGINTIIFCESWYRRNNLVDLFKSYLLKFIGNKYFVSGEWAYQHFTNRYAIHSDKVIKGYSVVDNNHFLINEERPKSYVLCVARYSEEKNLKFLIQCYSQSIISEKYELIIIGDGPLRESLNKEIIDLKIDRIILSKWKSYTELPEIYAGAIACILPSTFEPWGLVINEAMAAGLPVLISNECGCKPDLLEEGINGWSFDSNNKQQLIHVLDNFSKLNSLDIKNMGMHSKRKIQLFSPDSWANNIELMLSIKPTL